MKMILAEALEMIKRGETPEQYEKRVKRIKRLANERERLEDSRLEKQRKRLVKVREMIKELV